MRILRMDWRHSLLHAAADGVSLQKRGFQKALILGEKRESESEIKKIKKN